MTDEIKINVSLKDGFANKIMQGSCDEKYKPESGWWIKIKKTDKKEICGDVYSIISNNFGGNIAITEWISPHIIYHGHSPNLELLREPDYDLWDICRAVHVVEYYGEDEQDVIINFYNNTIITKNERLIQEAFNFIYLCPYDPFDL